MLDRSRPARSAHRGLSLPESDDPASRQPRFASPLDRMAVGKLLECESSLRFVRYDFQAGGHFDDDASIGHKNSLSRFK